MKITSTDKRDAIRVSRDHACALTNFNTATETITVVDPHDTATYKYELTYPEFCQLFDGIVGVKMAKPVQEPPKKRQRLTP